jgi:hypothetical protein
MDPDGYRDELCALRAATRPGLDWPKLYRFAVAAGCGESVPPDEEGFAAGATCGSLQRASCDCLTAR